MKIENSALPLVFINVGALAVAIIGAVAFKQLGAFSNYVPLKGIVMMSSGAAFFCVEGLIYLCTRKLCTRKNSKEPCLPTFHKPVEEGDSWTIKIPGIDQQIPFVRLQPSANFVPENNHFIVFTEQCFAGISLSIKYRDSEGIEERCLGLLQDGNLNNRFEGPLADVTQIWFKKFIEKNLKFQELPMSFEDGGIKISMTKNEKGPITIELPGYGSPFVFNVLKNFPKIQPNHFAVFALRSKNDTINFWVEYSADGETTSPFLIGVMDKGTFRPNSQTFKDVGNVMTGIPQPIYQE